MRFAFHLRPGDERHAEIFEALRRGAARHDDEIVEARKGGPVIWGADGGIVHGISGSNRKTFNWYRDNGKTGILIDKGYSRGAYLRVSINGSQPLAYFQARRHPGDRFEALGLEPRPYRIGTHILFDGPSDKFCAWKGLGTARSYALHSIERIARHSKAPIIYRPRWGRHSVEPIKGTEFSDGPLEDDLCRAKVVVSWGGNIGFDAVLAGAPHFAIGDSVARPLSETIWTQLDTPRVPSEDARRQWLHDVAYQQWLLSEFADGSAWAVLREQF